MKRLLQVANVGAYVVTVMTNYLSNAGLINGNTISEVSGRYHNYFTPAGYAFSIWALIYLALLGFVIYQGRSLFKPAARDRIVGLVGWWFVISCFCNCAWVVAWVNDSIGLSLCIMVLLLFSLIRILGRLEKTYKSAPWKKKIFAWWSFSIYAGWVSVAFLANLAAWLKKIQWQGLGISFITWTIIMIVIAGLVNLLVTWRRDMPEFSLAGLWAVTAIGIANWNMSLPVEVAAFFVASCLLLSNALYLIKNMKTAEV